MKIVKTKTKGSYLEVKSYWGIGYTKIVDPEGVDDEIVDTFHLNGNIPKIDMETWDAMVTFYFECAKIGYSLEAHTLLYLDTNNSKWYIVVPEQLVTSGSADVDNYNSGSLVDIVTGQEFKYVETDEYGLEWAGTSHSHNTMPLDMFSTKDDTDELKMSGVHILVSTIDPINYTYKITASVVSSKVRYLFDPNLIIKDIDQHKIEEPRCHKLYNNKISLAKEYSYINLGTPYYDSCLKQLKVPAPLLSRQIPSKIINANIDPYLDSFVNNYNSFDSFTEDPQVVSKYIEESIDSTKSMSLDEYHQYNENRTRTVRKKSSNVPRYNYKNSTQYDKNTKDIYEQDYEDMYNNIDLLTEKDFDNDYLDQCIEDFAFLGYTQEEVISRIKELYQEESIY